MNERSMKISDLGRKNENKQKFADCTRDEKIERLKDEIMNIRRSLSWANKVNNELRNKIERMEEHRHTADGQAVIALNKRIYDGQIDIAGMSVDQLA